MSTIAQVSEETLRLQAVVAELDPGSLITYADLQKQARVLMDTTGKAKLRTALKRAKREYSPVKGLGIQIASAEMGLTLISHRFRQIGSALKRSERTYENIQQQFWQEMTPDDQRRVLFVGSIFGAIKAAAANSKQLFANQPLPSLSQPIILEIPAIPGI